MIHNQHKNMLIIILMTITLHEVTNDDDDDDDCTLPQQTEWYFVFIFASREAFQLFIFRVCKWIKLTENIRKAAEEIKMKNEFLLRAMKTFIRKKMGHTMQYRLIKPHQ